MPARAVLLVVITLALPLTGDDEATGSGSPVGEAAPFAADPETEEPYAELDDLFRLAQPYLKNISPYQSSYFLLGVPLADSKFQLSFKYRFFNPTAPLARKHPWVGGFHFGYTQTSFWDLEADSRPFEDTSYKPELFYRSRNLPWRPGAVDGFFLQGGVQHESNGLSGDESRSTNFLYLSPVLVFFNPQGGLGLAVAPRFKYHENYDASGNADLEEYRGNFDVSVIVGKAEGLVSRFNIGTARQGWSFEADLTYPLGASWFESAQIYLHVQYVNALAESLLNYRERHEAFRLGIAFVR